MKQEQVKKQAHRREEEPIDDMPEVVDESALEESTTEVLGKIAVMLEDAQNGVQ